MKMGTNEVDNFMIGDSQVDKLMQGDVEVWSYIIPPSEEWITGTSIVANGLGLSCEGVNLMAYNTVLGEGEVIYNKETGVHVGLSLTEDANNHGFSVGGGVEGLAIIFSQGGIRTTVSGSLAFDSLTGFAEAQITSTVAGAVVEQIGIQGNADGSITFMFRPNTSSSWEYAPTSISMELT